jgi:hypothetical protein
MDSKNVLNNTKKFSTFINLKNNNKTDQEE